MILQAYATSKGIIEALFFPGKKVAFWRIPLKILMRKVLSEKLHQRRPQTVYSKQI